MMEREKDGLKKSARSQATLNSDHDRSKGISSNPDRYNRLQT